VVVEKTRQAISSEPRNLSDSYKIGASAAKAVQILRDLCRGKSHDPQRFSISTTNSKANIPQRRDARYNDNEKGKINGNAKNETRCNGCPVR
jgi:predicted secreted protein